MPPKSNSKTGTKKETPAMRSERLLKEQQGSFSVPTNTPDYVYNLFTGDFSGMTGSNMMFYYDTARKGFPFFYYLFLSTLIQRDTRIKTVLRRTKASIISEQFSFECEWKPGLELAEKVQAKLGAKMIQFFLDCVEANTKGIKRFEINFEFEDGLWLPSMLRPIPNHLYVYDERTNNYGFLDTTRIDMNGIRNFAYAEPDKLNIASLPQVTIDPVKVLDVFAFDREHENAFMDGVGLALMLAYYSKSYNVKDMNIFLEKFAMPTKVVKYDPANPKMKNELKKTTEESNKVHGDILLPNGNDITLLNDAQKGQGGQLYLNAINYWNGEIASLIIGEQESTQLGANGSYAAMKEKSKVSEDFATANLFVIMSAFNKLLQVTTDINFANPEAYPEMKYMKVKTLEDQKTLTDIYGNVDKLGYKPKKEALEEELQTELEEKQETEPVDHDEEDGEDDPKKKDGKYTRRLDSRTESWLDKMWSSIPKKEEAE